MIYNIIKDDLFNHACSIKDNVFNEEKRIPVHCISADFAMSGGIAVPMAEKFDLRDSLKFFYDVKSPDCIFVNNVMNLITKDKVWETPTYASLYKSLEMCKRTCISEDIKYLVMPHIGCGIDGLDWYSVSAFIKEIFNDTDIDILVCDL